MESDSTSPRPLPIPYDKISRVEVIDSDGRAFVRDEDDVRVLLDLQDDSRTLKLFVDSARTPYAAAGADTVPLDDVTRVVVIVRTGQGFGRVYPEAGVDVNIQDDGRTLRVVVRSSLPPAA
tara:strand:+ start:6771 stop:7133 length:363 start_codon:yes stop_codon:yes gene_type:complete